jgi:hypothetical protein
VCLYIPGLPLGLRDGVDQGSCPLGRVSYSGLHEVKGSVAHRHEYFCISRHLVRKPQRVDFRRGQEPRVGDAMRGDSEGPRVSLHSTVDGEFLTEEKHDY